MPTTRRLLEYILLLAIIPMTGTASEENVPPVDVPQSRVVSERLSAEIEREFQHRDPSRPRKRFVSGHKAGELQGYVNECLKRVLAASNENYPKAARGKTYGNLVASFSIRSSGTLESVEINRSSGHVALDNAIVKAIKLAAPFPSFPEEHKEKIDIISITERFEFARVIETENAQEQK